MAPGTLPRPGCPAPSQAPSRPGAGPVREDQRVAERAGTEEGRLAGGLPYLRLGSGPDLVLLDGFNPCNGNPTGLARRSILLLLRALAESSTVWLVNRRPGVPEGVSMADLAAEHATALADRFGAPVDVLGVSTGGSVGLQLAAAHPTVVRRLVITGAAHRVGDLGRRIMVRVAELHERGESRAAHREHVRMSAASPWRQLLLGDLQWLVEPLVFGRGIDRSDLVRTLRAEAVFDLGPRLGAITAPTLVVTGDQDLVCPPDLVTETVEGVRDGRLLVYKGRGHGEALIDRRFAQDVRVFLTAA